MLRIGGQRSVLSGLDSFGGGAMNLRFIRERRAIYR